MRTIIVLFILSILGMGLVAYSNTLPEYHDPEGAQTIHERPPLARVPSHSHEERRALRREYFKQWVADLATVQTNKWLYKDLGTALILTALSLMLLLMFSWLVGRHNVFDGKVLDDPVTSSPQTIKPKASWTNLLALRTPPNRIMFVVLGTIAHFGSLQAYPQSLVIDLGRHEVPIWANDFGPALYALSLSILYSWPVVVILGLLLLIPAKLPTHLWNWNVARPIWSWLWTIVHVIPAVLLVVALSRSFTRSTVWAVPFLILGLYLVLSCRSAGLAPKKA